jgi:hypothetical protein
MSRSGASSIVRGIHCLLIRSSTHKDDTGRDLFALAELGFGAAEIERLAAEKIVGLVKA